MNVLADEARRALASGVGAGVVDRYAMALYVDGQVDQCADQLRCAVELAPEDPTIVLHFSLVLEKQARYAEALKYAEILLELVPNDPSYRNMRDSLKRKVNQ